MPKSPKLFSEYYYENFLAMGDRFSYSSLISKLISNFPFSNKFYENFLAEFKILPTELRCAEEVELLAPIALEAYTD